MAIKAIWAYETFAFINRAYFSGRLLLAVILFWGINPTRQMYRLGPNTVRDKSRPPIICLHPSLLGGTEKLEPWKIKSTWLWAGPRLRYPATRVHPHSYWIQSRRQRWADEP